MKKLLFSMILAFSFGSVLHAKITSTADSIGDGCGYESDKKSIECKTLQDIYTFRKIEEHNYKYVEFIDDVTDNEGMVAFLEKFKITKLSKDTEQNSNMLLSAMIEESKEANEEISDEKINSFKNQFLPDLISYIETTVYLSSKICDNWKKLDIEDKTTLLAMHYRPKDLKKFEFKMKPAITNGEVQNIMCKLKAFAPQ